MDVDAIMQKWGRKSAAIERAEPVDTGVDVLADFRESARGEKKKIIEVQCRSLLFQFHLTKSSLFHGQDYRRFIRYLLPSVVSPVD